MRRLAFAGKLVVLAATFLALAATSIRPTCPPESGLLDGPLALRAETDCGPPGPVVLRVERSCDVHLEGGLAVGLPDRGTAYWEYNRTLRLQTDAYLGLYLPSDEEPSTSCALRHDGVARFGVECITWAHPKGAWKPMREVRRCGGVLRLPPESVPSPPSPPVSPPTG